MACTTITLSGMSVGCKDNMPGIKTIYIIKNENVVSTTIGTTGADLGKITNITTKEIGTEGETEHFKTYQFRKQTSSFTSTMNTDDTTGTFYITSEIAVQFGKMTNERNQEVEALMKEDLTVIVKDQSDRYWYFGYDNPVTASAGTAQTGVGGTDLNGYNVTFSDTSKGLPKEVVSTALTNLIDDAPID